MAVSQKHSGWRRNEPSDRLELYYKGTLVGYLNASGFTVTDGSTSYVTNGAAQYSGIASGQRVRVVKLGSTAAIASNGANALLVDPVFVAPAAVKVLSVWKTNATASDVTAGTATSSASFRRTTIIGNTAGTGSGTTVVASLNATASLASGATRAFSVTTDNSLAAGAIVQVSHLTVGAATADGTDAAAGHYFLAYEHL